MCHPLEHLVDATALVQVLLFLSPRIKEHTGHACLFHLQ